VGILTATFKVLKFPLKLLSGPVGSKQKRLKKTKLEQKQLKYVRNFDPTRLKNKSWQIRSGKKSNKKQKKHFKRRRKSKKIT